MNNDFKNDDIRDLIIERDGYLEQVKELEQELQRKDNIIKDIKEYVNYLIIFNQTINGKFSETQWGQDILGFIEENIFIK